MSFSACPLHDFGADRWDDLVDRFDEAWLWHRSDFREWVDFWFEQADHSFVVLDEAAHPVALVPLRLTHYRASRIMPVRTLRSTGGPATANDLGAKYRGKVLAFVHERLLALACQLGAMDIDMSCPPMAPALRGEQCPSANPLAWIGCSGSLAHTWVVDLRRSEDAIRKAYRRDTREELKKFAREPFDIRGGPQDGDAQTFYSLLTATFSRRGLPLHPRAYIQHVFDRFVQRGFARLLFLVRDGAVVAANITATYKGGDQYWFGASRDAQMGGANRVLVDHQIMKAKAGGSEFFETGQAYLFGGDQALRGISEFKRSFGSELYPLFQGSIIVRPRMYAALQLIRSFHAGR